MERGAGFMLRQLISRKKLRQSTLTSIIVKTIGVRILAVLAATVAEDRHRTGTRENQKSS